MSRGAALFDRPSETTQPRSLLQFRAGKMILKTDNWLHADPRKGWAYIYQTSDSNVHFCWIDRLTGMVEENYVLKPKQAEFKRVAQCSTGRVYVLKLKTKKMFIWMQNPNASTDKANYEKVNRIIDSPSPVPPGQMADWIDGFNSLGRLSQNDILALLSVGVGFGSGVSSESDTPSVRAVSGTAGRHLTSTHAETASTQIATASPIPTTAAAAVTPTVVSSDSHEPSESSQSRGTRSEKGNIQLKDLLHIMSSINNQDPVLPSVVELTDVITEKTLSDLIIKPELQDRMLPHLPPLDPEAEPLDPWKNIQLTLRSSQLKSALKSFSAALRTGQLHSVVSQFNLGDEAVKAASSGDMDAFARALEKHFNSKSSTEPDPEQMDTT